jgi:glycosyltransferase involved in cell wall biosynthesis
VNILFHCVYFPPEVGGLESHVFYLAKALAERGHQVQVVTSLSQPGLPEEEDLGGVHVFRTWFPARGPAGWIAHALGSVPKTRALAVEADIIHAQAFASIVPAAAGRRRARIPMVATFHTSHFLTRAEKRAWKPILARLVRTPDYALASSEEIAAVAMGLAPGTKVEALANGVETSFFRKVDPALPRQGERLRIVVPRRLFPKNGVEFFVRSVPLILQSLDVEAILVGEGPERGRLEGLAEDLGVSDRLSFLGKRAHSEMPGLLSSGDLAVIPSLMEATSVAALEAMACELPVVASNVGGLPEIVNDEVGALFEAGNPEALAEAVVRLLSEGGLGEKGVRARERVVAHWSNDRLAERHLEIYSELLRGRD